MNEYSLEVVKELVPTKVRKWAYAILALVSIALSAITAGFVASSYGVPEWLTVALAVLGVLAGPFGFLAANNVDPSIGTALPELVINNYDGTDDAL